MRRETKRDGDEGMKVRGERREKGYRFPLGPSDLGIRQQPVTSEAVVSLFSPHHQVTLASGSLYCGVLCELTDLGCFFISLLPDPCAHSFKPSNYDIRHSDPSKSEPSLLTHLTASAERPRSGLWTREPHFARRSWHRQTRSSPPK